MSCLAINLLLSLVDLQYHYLLGQQTYLTGKTLDIACLLDLLINLMILHA